MLNLRVIWAVLCRNVQGYFSGVLGYLVIVLFVTVAAFCAFSPEFFANNLANLDQLSVMFPFLLLAMVPAITMSSWAEERKLGTSEILFTLPARDVEIMLGKYFAALTIYTIALSFSCTQLFVLAWIGNPDWGVVFTTYIGYWLAGASLLSAGMFASVLTSSTTVAYVLGATLCAIPVLIGNLTPGNVLMQSLSLSWQLRDFTAGMIPLTGVLYFVALTIFMLYLNLVFISRRHWSGGEKAAMGVQYTIRGVSLAAALISINFMANQSVASFVTRIDATSEGLYSLSDTTRETIDHAAENDRVVEIRAFVSPEVPQSFVHARKQLVGLLQQYDRIGGANVDLELIEVEPNSAQATEARKLGVKPVRHESEVGGKQVEQDVFMGVVITSSLGEVVLPFLDGETSMEYELTRSIATTTTRAERLKIGVLETDALRIDDPFIRRFYERTLERLGQQYKLVNVTSSQLSNYAQEDGAYPVLRFFMPDWKSSKPDVLLVVQPTSLTSDVNSDLIQYIQRGNPTLLLDDPLPMFPFVYYRPEDLGVVNAPSQDRPSPDAPLSWVSNAPQLPLSPELQSEQMRIQQQLQQMPPQFAQQMAHSMMQRFYNDHPEARPRFEPKADDGTASSLMKAIGLEWNSGRAVWDNFNPHPDYLPRWIPYLGQEWPESYGRREDFALFVTPDNGADQAFNSGSPISNGLKDMLFFYPGAIRESQNANVSFVPLARTSVDSGLIQWEDLTRVEMGTTVVRDQFTGEIISQKREPQRSPLTDRPLQRLAPRPPRTADDNSHVIAAHVTSKQDQEPKINVVFVADLDFISDLYFEQVEELETPADNITFLFNAIEVLAGDDSFARLRTRRPVPRRLTAIQSTIDEFRKERTKQQNEIEQEIGKQLKDANDELEKVLAENNIQSDLDMLLQTRSDREKLSTDVAKVQKDFEIKERKLKEELQQKVDELKATEQASVDALENRTRFFAVVLPPIPALLLGIGVLVFFVVNEQRRVVDSRRRD